MTLEITKILTITTKYKATKRTCKFVAEKLYEDRLGFMDFYDPQDKSINPVDVCRGWFGKQRPNKIVWILEDIEIDKHQWEDI